MTISTTAATGDTAPPAPETCRHCGQPIRRIALTDLRGLGARTTDAYNRMLATLRGDVGGDTIWITVGEVERHTCASGNVYHEPPPTRQQIVLDARTDATLAESLAALTPELHTQLLRVAHDRLLVDRIRAAIAEQFPAHRTPIGALFEPCMEDDDGSYLGGEGIVLFADGTVDDLYDEALEPTLGHRWPNVGRDFLLTIDLRGEGTSAHSNAGSPSDIHTHFGVTPPA